MVLGKRSFECCRLDNTWNVSHAIRQGQFLAERTRFLRLALPEEDWPITSQTDVVDLPERAKTIIVEAADAQIR